MPGTLLIALGSLALALVFHGELAGYPPEARRLPGLLVWIVAGLAVLMVLEEGWKHWGRRRDSATDDTGDESVRAGTPIMWSALLPFAAVITAYVALLPVVGYLIATPVFVGGVLLVSRTIHPAAAVATALGITGALWAIFVWTLHLPMPLWPASFGP